MEKRPILPPDPVEAAILIGEIEARKTVQPSGGEDIDDSQVQGEGEALDEARKAAQRGRTA
ncbi:MAG: hypothetical protein Q8R02_11585 [Hyphomonadaceae bacterium]|nr:hypothetical protein [Hyphomonadaceae bacterium]